MGGLRDQHPKSVGPPRRMRADEKAVITALMKASPRSSEFERALETIIVRSMNDGDMGSVLFAPADDRKRLFGCEIASAEFVDEDGVPVSLALNVDQYGDLFELDIWKKDFSPLIRYPGVSDLKIVRLASS